MNDKDHLKAELRAVREELAHRDITNRSMTNGTLLSPPMDLQFARITQLSDEQLKQHEERLERDLQDIDIDNPSQLYRPTDNDESKESK